MTSSNAAPRPDTPEMLAEPLPKEVAGEARAHWPGALAVFVVLLALWEWACRGLGVTPNLLPSPSAVGIEIVDNFPILLRHTWVTTVELLAGFAIATVIGIALAILVDRSRVLSSVIRPYIIVSAVEGPSWRR
jgi:ABC-type nitrate/sulfonate/bicarbonate transport system permease component